MHPCGEIADRLMLIRVKAGGSKQRAPVAQIVNTRYMYQGKHAMNVASRELDRLQMKSDEQRWDKMIIVRLGEKIIPIGNEWST